LPVSGAQAGQRLCHEPPALQTLVVVLHHHPRAVLVQWHLGATLLLAAIVVDQIPRNTADERSDAGRVADLSFARRPKDREENVLRQISGSIAIARAREHHRADTRPEIVDHLGLRFPIPVGDSRDERGQIGIVRDAHD
jgi:hypothetical protein